MAGLSPRRRAQRPYAPAISLRVRTALLSEVAGTSPAMTNGEPYPSSGFMFASLMILT